MEKDLPVADQARIAQAAGGLTLKDLSRGLVDAIAADLPADQVAAATQAAIKPFANPQLRELIVNLKRANEQVIDDVTQDQVLEAGFSEAAKERARKLVGTFEQFIEEHKDEITALQILYNRPVKAPLKFDDLKALADTLHAPPHLISESALWQAYAALDRTKVKGGNTKRILTDLVSLVCYAMHQENELVPYPERVAANFKSWMARQQASGKAFTDEQRWWLEKMAEHVASNLGLEREDFGYAPFNLAGGLGKVHLLFGAELPRMIEAMNSELVA